MRLRSLRLACLSVAVAAACSDSPNSPTLFGIDNGTPRNGTIWVYDVLGEEQPKQVGEGTLAVWSWR